MGDQKPAVVLLSGGLDSATTLAIARREGFNPYALSFRYGQRHQAGVEAAVAGRREPRRRPAHRARYRPAAVRRVGPHGGPGGPEGAGPPKRCPQGSLSPTCRPGTRSSCRSRWPGPRCSARRHLHRRQRPRLQRLSGLPAGVHRGVPADGQPGHQGMGVEGSRPLTIHTPLIHLTKAEIIRTGLELGRRLRPDAQLLRPRPRRRGLRALRRLPAAPEGLRRERSGRSGPLLLECRGGRMSYAVKEIFYTLQGEGANAGRPAVFCRFAGCNLWSGREEDRATRDLPLLRHRLRRHRRPGRRRFAPAGELAAAVAEPLAGRLLRAGAAVRGLHGRGAAAATGRRGWSRPCTRGFRDRRRDQRHASAAPRARLDLRQPEGRGRARSCAGNELKLVFPQPGARRSVRGPRFPAISSSSPWTAPTGRGTPGSPCATAWSTRSGG